MDLSWKMIPEKSNVFETIYVNLNERKLAEATFIICSLLLSLFCCCVMLGWAMYCCSSKYKKRKNIYVPSAYFKNSLCKSLEDSIYFSEVSPSSDSSTCSRSNSTVTTVSEDTSRMWFSLDMRRRSSTKSRADNPTTVYICLKFVPSDEETRQHGKLHISIKNIISLPAKDYPRYTEAYLILRCVRVQRSLKGRTETVICENRTKNFRNTRDIEMDEHFVIDAKKTDLKNWNITITAYDQDIYTKPSELASAVISLSRKYKEICSPKQGGIELTTLLKPVPKNVGNLLVGLSYLPTSQRLSVNIVRVANLPQSKQTSGKIYAQLFLLTGVTGRSLKRKKLLFSPPNDDPEDLNGTISFDITPNLLETVTLLIILYKEAKKCDSLDSVTQTIDPEKMLKPADHYFGSVAIGNMVSGHKGKKHWRMMMVAPRRVVTVWHTLK